jgi:hypothetical protein
MYGTNGNRRECLWEARESKSHFLEWAIIGFAPGMRLERMNSSAGKGFASVGGGARICDLILSVASRRNGQL